MNRIGSCLIWVATATVKNLQPALTEGKRGISVAVHKNQQIIALWPGFRDRAYGVAVDVGSTTIAAHLCDLGSGEVLASASLMNPQIRFGEDLMSRVSYVMMHPEGAEEMTTVIREALNSCLLKWPRQIDARLRIFLKSLGGQPGYASYFAGH